MPPATHVAMTADADYYANHFLKMRFPWSLYHRPIVRELASAIREAKGPRILNVGSGPFIEFDEVALPDREFSICDIDERAIELAKKTYGARLSAAEVIKVGNPFPFQSNSFDLVVAMEVIEHVIDPLPWLVELLRVARPGGELFLTTPNYGSWSLRAIESTVLEVVARRNGFSRKGIHPTPMTCKRLQDVLLKAGAVGTRIHTLSQGWVLASHSQKPKVD